MAIQPLETSYYQIVNSELIQTTVQAIQSLIERIFINPSDQCLMGHVLAIGFLSCLDMTSGGIVYYSLLLELIFFTIQEGRYFYHSIKNVFARY